MGGDKPKAFKSQSQNQANSDAMIIIEVFTTARFSSLKGNKGSTGEGEGVRCVREKGGQ